MGLRKDVVTTPYAFADYVETEDDVRVVLSAAFESNDPATIKRKIGAIAPSRGMAAIAAATGLQREGLYKSLSETGNPELKTLLKILDALGLVLTIRPKRAARADAPASAAPGLSEPVETDVAATERMASAMPSKRTTTQGARRAPAKAIAAKVAPGTAAKSASKRAASSKAGYKKAPRISARTIKSDPSCRKQ